MAEGRIRTLLVEDNQGDARLLQLFLTESRAARFDITHVDRLAPAVVLLKEQEFDVVLLDLSLPDAKGVDTVVRTHAAARGTPIVVMTALDDEETAVEAVKLGAQDYLVKGRIDTSLVARSVRHAIERQRATVELARLNELKNQFLGMAAHDLRNPLAVVQTCSEFLLDEVGKTLSEEKKAEFLTRIRNNAAFMLYLIDDLLDVSRIESGKLTLNIGTTDLVELVNRNLELNRTLASRKHIGLQFTHDAAQCMVMADSRRVEQVLSNLISNAVKFSVSGSEVVVRAGQVDGGLGVSVADHGQGIPAEELSGLFEPFNRTSVRSTAGEKSTGLGLAICRKIVEAHLGRIWAESKVGVGTTISFTLPAVE